MRWVERPFWRARRAWEALPKVTGGFRRVGRGQKALLEGQERSGGTPGGLGVIRRPIQTAMMCREGSRSPPRGLEAL